LFHQALPSPPYEHGSYAGRALFALFLHATGGRRERGRMMESSPELRLKSRPTEIASGWRASGPQDISEKPYALFLYFLSEFA
jgi:hypothetical protein